MISRTRRVVFDGYYGMHNVGDDAFCVVAQDVAVKQWGCDEVSYLARPGHLPDLPGRVLALEPEHPRFRGHLRLSVLGSMVRRRRVVHVGGSTFMKPLTRHRDQARLARAGLLELHGVGVSIGPFADREAALGVRSILSAFRSLSVRDRASLERLDEIAPDLRAREGFDVAVLLDRRSGPSSKGSPRDRPVIGVTVCAHESARGEDGDRERQRFERTLEAVRLASRELEAVVRILVFNDHPRWGDQGLSSELAQRLGHDCEIVPRPRDPRVMLESIADCDVVVATRLHSAIFAYRCEVPFLMIAYQSKGEDLAKDVALPDRYVFGAGGPPPPAAANAIVELVEAGRPSALRPVEEARTLAAQAFPRRV